MEGGVLLEDFHDAVLEGAALGRLAEGESRAEGDVEELAATGFVEVNALVVGGGSLGEGGDAGVGGGDVVAGLVLGEAAGAKGGDFAEEVFVHADDGAKRFEVAGAGGLEVEAVATDAANDGVDGELVGAGVDGDFVGAEALGDGGVGAELLLEDGEVAFVVHALFEIADEARGEGDDAVEHLAALELKGPKEVLERAGGGIGLVNGDFDLVGALEGGGKVLAERFDLGDGAAIFDGGAVQALAVELEFDAVADVVFALEVGEVPAGGENVVLEEGGYLDVNLGRVELVGGVVDVRGGVEREEGETGAGGVINVGGGLEVVAIGSPRFEVAGGGEGVLRSAHDVLRGALGAGHLADGLLGEDAGEAGAVGAEGGEVAGAGEAEAVAKAEGFSEAEGGGSGEGHGCKKNVEGRR